MNPQEQEDNRLEGMSLKVIEHAWMTFLVRNPIDVSESAKDRFIKALLQAIQPWKEKCEALQSDKNFMYGQITQLRADIKRKDEELNKCYHAIYAYKDWKGLTEESTLTQAMRHARNALSLTQATETEKKG